ncbi:hypothetical protein BaRGS_00037367, partial [Batillaria attramentaria]
IGSENHSRAKFAGFHFLSILLTRWCQMLGRTPGVTVRGHAELLSVVDGRIRRLGGIDPETSTTGDRSHEHDLPPSLGRLMCDDKHWR